MKTGGKRAERKDEGLTTETPALETLSSGQFTLSTQLIIPPLMQHHNVFQNLPSLFMRKDGVHSWSYRVSLTIAQLGFSLMLTCKSSFYPRCQWIWLAETLVLPEVLGKCEI